MARKVFKQRREKVIRRLENIPVRIFMICVRYIWGDEIKWVEGKAVCCRCEGK